MKTVLKGKYLFILLISLSIFSFSGEDCFADRLEGLNKTYQSMEIRKDQLKNEAENIYRNIFSSENPKKDLKRLQEIENHLINLNHLIENIKKEIEDIRNENDAEKTDIEEFPQYHKEKLIEKVSLNQPLKIEESSIPPPIATDIQALRTEKNMTVTADPKAEVKNTPLSFVENNNREIMITTILFVFLLFIGRIVFYKILSSLMGSSPHILYRFSKNFRNRLKQRRNTKKAYVRVDSGIENLRDSINNITNNEPYRFRNSISPESLRFEPIAAETQQPIADNNIRQNGQQNTRPQSNRQTSENIRPFRSGRSGIPEGRINHQTSTDERGGRIDSTYIGSNIDGRVPVNLLGKTKERRNQMKEIDWVSQNPEKYGKRLIFEAEQLKTSYPLFGFHIDNRELFVEGPLITRSNNVYLARAYYPSNYPYSPPSPIITDRDVVDFCNTYGMHNFHNYGTFRDVGIKLCVMKPDDAIGEGWKLNYSVVTIINYMALWLHAYEYKKEKGVWLLPEA